MQNVKPQLCDYVVTSYRHGFYCDLHIYCGESLGVEPLRCHQLVLSSISKYMCKILAGIPTEPSQVVSLHIPDFDVRQVQHFLDTVYYKVGQPDSSGSLEEVVVDPDLAKLFQLDSSYPGSPLDDVRYYLNYNEEESEEEADLEWGREWDRPQVPGSSKKRGRKRKGDGSGGDPNDPKKADVKPEPEDGGEFDNEVTPYATAKLEMEQYYSGDSDGGEGDGDEESGGRLVGHLDPKNKERSQYKTSGPKLGPFVEYDAFKAMVESCSGIFKGVSTRPIPFKLWKVGNTQCKSSSRQDMRYMCPFRALCGLVQIGKHQFKAKPLAWADATTEQMPKQYDEVVAAYRHLYGLSEGDVTSHSWMVTKQGLGQDKDFQNKPRIFLDKHADLSDEELKAMLDDPRLKAFQHRTPIKPYKLKLKACCDIELVDALTVNDFDGMGVIMADKDVNKMLLRPIRVNQDRIDDYADDCMRILFDTWRTKNFFPPCPYLADKYLASEDLMLVPKCIPRILQQRTQEGTGRTCEICGAMLPYVTQNDINNYTRHQKKHKFETWKCSCDATFSGYKETERHVKLYHSKGDYIQCEKCISVMQRKYMAKHLDQCHRDFICNVCGKICHNSNALRVHGLDHKPYQCKTCFEQMIGVTRWRAHKKNSPHCFMDRGTSTMHPGFKLQP